MWICLVWAERSTFDSFGVPSHRCNSATGDQKGITQTIYTDSEPPSLLPNSLMPSAKLRSAKLQVFTSLVWRGRGSNPGLSHSQRTLLTTMLRRGGARLMGVTFIDNVSRGMFVSELCEKTGSRDSHHDEPFNASCIQRTKNGHRWTTYNYAQPATDHVTYHRYVPHMLCTCCTYVSACWVVNVFFGGKFTAVYFPIIALEA